MDINESYELAVKLGYDENTNGVCNMCYNDKGEQTYWWNGLQIPLEHVGIVDIYDPRCSGRYPWYLEMMKEKGLA